MDLSQNKKEVSWALTALAVFLAITTVGSAVEVVNSVKQNKFIDPSEGYANTISVSGEGKVFAKPDIGAIGVSIVSNAKTVDQATKDNNEKMNRVTAGIKELGVTDSDVKTTAYNITPQYSYPPNGQRNLTGYEVRQTIEIKIRDLAKSGEIIAKATSLGANEVGGLNFTVDDAEAYRQEARVKAIKQAEDKAREIAKSLGIKLTKVTNFYEDDNTDQPMPYYGIGGGGGEVVKTATPEIQTGENEIVVNVNLTYQIK